MLVLRVKILKSMVEKAARLVVLRVDRTVRLVRTVLAEN